MAVEENIQSVEDLAAVDPFADPSPSAESVFGFPDIQKEADNTSLFEHTDHGTTMAVNDMHADLDEHFTYKRELDNKEITSIDENLEHVTNNDDQWAVRLERMANRKLDPATDLLNDSHDYIEEEEREIYGDDPEFIRYDEVDIPSTDVLDELETIQNQLTAIGGVSRNEIITLESLLESPGLFGNPRAFSATHSRAGYTATMETLGSSIKAIIKDIIKRIIDGCKALADFIKKGLGVDFMSQHMSVSLIVRRQELLGQARRIDAVYGLQSWKRMTSATDIPPYKEATSTESFVIRYLDYRTRQRFQARYTLGLRMIAASSGLATHVKTLRTEIDRVLAQADSYVSMLAKNEPDQWGGVDTTLNMQGLAGLMSFWNLKVGNTPTESMSEYRSAVNLAFRQEDTAGRRPWEFVKAASYANPFSDNPSFSRTVGSNIDRIARSLKDLDRKVQGLSDNAQYNVATGKLLEIQRRLSLAQNMFSMYMTFAKYYESYYQMLAQPIMVLQRQMTIFRTKEMATGMMGGSNESIEVSTEDFLIGPEYFDGLMRAQGWKPDAEKEVERQVVEDKVVENKALSCASQINAQGFDGLKGLLRQAYRDSWLFSKQYQDEEGSIEYLKNAGLIYQPKVLDLESETPDWGITPFGREVGSLLFTVKDETERDPKVTQILDSIWDDERIGARDLLREHAVDGNRGIHQPAIKSQTDIDYLVSNGLANPTSKHNHPIHDADEGSYFVTSLGMEVAKHF